MAQTVTIEPKKTHIGDSMFEFLREAVRGPCWHVYRAEIKKLEEEQLKLRQSNNTFRSVALSNTGKEITLSTGEIDVPRFVSESIRLSGEIPPPQWQDKDHVAKKGDKSVSDEAKIHLDVATSVIQSRSSGLQNPAIINAELCNSRGKFLFRASTLLDDFPAPEGMHSGSAVEAWTHCMERLIDVEMRRLIDVRELLDSMDDREALAWLGHDLLVSCRFFRDANDRTARIMLQNMRRLLRLQPVIVWYVNKNLHRARITLFKTLILQPMIVHCGLKQ